MIKIRFISSAENIQKMRSYGPKIIQTLFSRINILMTQLGAKVTQKLSGEVLKVRTGVLRGSVQVEPTRFDGKSIIGRVSVAGPPAQYGQFHETGIPHAWEVMASKQKFLKFAIDGKTHFAKSIVHPALKQRAFAKPSEDEMRETIISDLRAAVDRVTEE